MYDTITRIDFGAPPMSNQFTNRASARRFAQRESRHELCLRVEIYQGASEHPCLVYERGKCVLRAPYGSGKSSMYTKGMRS